VPSIFGLSSLSPVVAPAYGPMNSTTSVSSMSVGRASTLPAIGLPSKKAVTAGGGAGMGG
jgi:hypothetical protein